MCWNQLHSLVMVTGKNRHEFCSSSPPAVFRHCLERRNFMKSGEFLDMKCPVYDFCYLWNVLWNPPPFIKVCTSSAQSLLNTLPRPLLIKLWPPPPLALSKYASPPSIYQNMIHPPTPFIKLCPPPRLKLFTLADFCWQSFVLFSWWTNLHSEIERSISVSTEFVKNNNILQLFAMFCNFCTREVVVISRNYVNYRNLVKIIHFL